MPPSDDLREKAASVLRAAAHERREAERALTACTSDLDALATASVESLETLADTVEAFLPQMPDVVRPPLEVSLRAAWERLQAAGIQRDGAVGEAVDLTRHRVVKAMGGDNGREVVHGVLAAGITFKGRRIREAVVSTTRKGEAGGAHRH